MKWKQIVLLVLTFIGRKKCGQDLLYQQLKKYPTRFVLKK